MTYTEEQITRAIVYAHFNAWKIVYQQRVLWMIAASKHHPCSSCEAPEFTGCLNKTDIRRGVDPPGKNKLPHDERVDWVMLLNLLRIAGMYRESVENQTRNLIERDEREREEKKRGRRKAQKGA